MTSFQLDQNVNKKSLARDCERQGLANVARFPSEWKNRPGGFKDPDLLPIVMKGNRTFVTNDRKIAQENASAIPDEHPGIIIVGFCKGTVKPIGRGSIEGILASFKIKYPDWHVVSWSNTIAEITQQSVEVWHIENGILRSDEYLPFDRPFWTTALSDWLSKNSNRHRMNGPGAPPISLPPTE